MKFLKYIIIAFASMAALVSCDKHEQAYKCEQVDASEKALIQIMRMVPEASTTATRVMSITIDDQVLWQENYTYLGARGMVPSQSRHYILDPGTHHMKWFLADGSIFYESDFTVGAGMQDLFVTDLTAAPIVVDNNAEYPSDATDITSTWAYIRFVNMMYEDENKTIPDYKLQYYYQDPTDLEWYPVSDPVGFGEAAVWGRVHVDQFAAQRSGQSGSGSSRNADDNRVGYAVSSGSCTIYYKAKMIGADGSDLGWMTYTFKGEGSTESEYKDYWTAYVGRKSQHIMRGCRISSTNNNTSGAYVSQIWKY